MNNSNFHARKWLTNNGFTETTDTAPLGSAVFTKSMTKTVEVVWHGKQDSTLTVTVTLRADNSIHVHYEKNGQTFKTKVHSYGWMKAVRAIESTVDYAGFDLYAVDTGEEAAL